MLLLFSGCRDAFNECLSGPGKLKTKRMGLYSFRNLRIKDNINLTLISGDNYELEITAGENIIPMLGIEIINNTLSLSNRSTCPLLKNPWKGIEMKLTVPRLDTLFVASYGQVKSTIPFIDDYLLISISDSPAEIDLQVDCNFLRVENLSGTAAIKISGNAKNVECYHVGFGKIDFIDLYSKIMSINMQSTNDSHLRGGDNYFYAALSNIGNVYYYNDPLTIDLIRYDSGGLIRAYP